jgi:hypothetical protein
MEYTKLPEVKREQRRRDPLPLIVGSNGSEVKIKRPNRDWEYLIDPPIQPYTPPDSSPMYQRLLYTGGHLFLKAYWPKYGDLRKKFKEARQRAKLKSHDSEIFEGS